MITLYFKIDTYVRFIGRHEVGESCMAEIYRKVLFIGINTNE